MERLDRTGFGDISLLQDTEAFCYGVDAVLLSDFAAKDILQNFRNSHQIELKAIDLGSGNGIIPLILSHKAAFQKIYGVEIQQNSYELFLRNIEINALENRISAIKADVKELTASFPELKNQFHCITSNPPYVKRSAGIPNTNLQKQIARHETSADIFDFVKTASELLAKSGAFYMIHRPQRLSDIYKALLENNLNIEILQPIATDCGSPPSMLLIKACKHSKKDLKFLKTLCIYDGIGKYTEIINEIYER